MKKHLFPTKAHFDSWLTTFIDEDATPAKTSFDGLEQVEHFFGIQLLDANGHTYEESEDAREDGQPDTWTPAIPILYNVKPLAGRVAMIPDSYPCLALSWMESSWDRNGDVVIRCLEFAYPEDFNAPAYSKASEEALAIA